jgi:hypothetical protein
MRAQIASRRPRHEKTLKTPLRLPGEIKIAGVVTFAEMTGFAITARPRRSAPSFQDLHGRGCGSGTPTCR